MRRSLDAAVAARGRGEQGFALVVAVGFLLIVTAMIAPFVLAARAALDSGTATLRRDRMQLVAEGLATAVASRLVAMPDEERSRLVRSLRSGPAGCRSGDVAAVLLLQDQRGLVDLNSAGEGLLEAALRAVGLDGATAARHAAAIAAYRIAPDREDPWSDTATALVRGGLKGAPFEAVEELHDFGALAGISPALLAQAFTVHSRQPQIVGATMPDSLAAVLPRRPTPGFPDILEGTSGPGSYRIGVLVRAADGTIGYTAPVVAVSPGSFSVLERGSIVPPIHAEPAVAQGCEALFGPAARLLRQDPP